MSQETVIEPEPIRQRPLRTIGALNVIVGGFLLLCGGAGLYTIVPFLLTSSPFQLDPHETQIGLESVRWQLIDDLRQMERSVQAEAAKTRLRKVRQDLEAKPSKIEGELDFRKINADLPWLSRYLWAEVLTGPPLNLLMLVSGVGLVVRKNWGRMLAVWVAAMKIARLIALCLFLAVVVWPSTTRVVEEFLRTDVFKSFLHVAIEKVSAGQGAGPASAVNVSPEEFVQVFSVLGPMFALILLGFGAVYPAVVLLVLGRAGVSKGRRDRRGTGGFAINNSTWLTIPPATEAGLSVLYRSGIDPPSRERTAMAGPASKGFTPPNFRTPRLLGIFNVLFASQILVCGLCMGTYTLTMPIWGRVMVQAQNQAKSQVENSNKAALDAVDDQLKEAKTDKEKAELEARKKEIETRPKIIMPGMMDFSKMGLDDPKLVGWTWTEVISGLVLNALMVASGVGLMNWKPWGWSLAFWTSVLKILRLCLMYGFFIVAIVPPMSQRIGNMVGDMLVAQQATVGRAGTMPPVSMFTRIYTVTYSAMGLSMMLVGVIYPALQIWWLTRPGVKLACSGTMKLPREPRQPW